MKKFVLFPVLLFFLVLSGGKIYSQDVPIRLGLKVAPAISWMNPNEKNYLNDGSAVGVSLGFISEFYFSEHYAFGTGFNFSFLGGKLQFPHQEDDNSGILNRKYSMRYLEIPLLIKMKTKEYGKFSFFGQIGFGTGFNLRTKVKDDFMTDDNGTVSSTRNLKSNETSLIREAIIAGIGTEYQIDESVALMLSIGYSNSLNNVLRGQNLKDTNLKNRSSLNLVELNVGVLF